MSKPIELVTFQATVNQDIVAMLEQYLDEAKRGEISMLALAGIRPDHSCVTQSSGGERVQSLLGAIVILQNRILNEAMQ